MPSKLKERLAALRESLGRQSKLHARAVRRMKARHEGQKKAERETRKQRERADAFRAVGEPARARYQDQKAGKARVKGERECDRAIFWRGRAKVIAARIAGIETDIGEIQRELDRFEVRIVGNTAKGGSDFERWLAVQNASVANCAKGMPGGRRNFYSLYGGWDVDHPIEPGEEYGERSDCSQTLTAWAKAASLPDPNGNDFNGGYTGTQTQGRNGWRQVSLSTMLASRKPAYIIYGEGTGKHVEGWCPRLDANGNFLDSMRTAGHGSAPVDYGTVYLFGAGYPMRFYIYDPS